MMALPCERPAFITGLGAEPSWVLQDGSCVPHAVCWMLQVRMLQVLEANAAGLTHRPGRHIIPLSGSDRVVTCRAVARAAGAGCRGGAAAGGGAQREGRRGRRGARRRAQQRAAGRGAWSAQTLSPVFHAWKMSPRQGFMMWVMAASSCCREYQTSARILYPCPHAIMPMSCITRSQPRQVVVRALSSRRRAQRPPSLRRRPPNQQPRQTSRQASALRRPCAQPSAGTAAWRAAASSPRSSARRASLHLAAAHSSVRLSASCHVLSSGR